MLQVLNEPGEGPSGIISFAQFISFLINGTRSSRVNVELSQTIMAHSGYWTPYWKLCTPCHSDAIPTTIVKMDGGQFEQEVSQALPIVFVTVDYMASTCPLLRNKRFLLKQIVLAKCFKICNIFIIRKST